MPAYVDDDASGPFFVPMEYARMLPISGSEVET